MRTLDTTLKDLPDGATVVRLSDAVATHDGTIVGQVDRALVTPDLRHCSHVGVQPTRVYEWPRLVPIEHLAMGAPQDDHVLVLSPDAPWPDGYRTADTLPGVKESEYPHHPRHPLSPLQQFVLALLEPGLAGELGVAARIRERLPDGTTALRAGSTLLGWAGVAVGKLGEVQGLLVDDHGDVTEVLVTHKRGILGQRLARLPIQEVVRAGIDEAATSLTPRDLERYDLPAET
jgi:hypothetical protein